MKEAVDSKTGVKEIQSDEHVPVGPVRITKSKPPRNPLDVLHERVQNLKATIERQDTQIRSLQQAVAAIERRQMPLVQASHDDCHNPNCDVCHPKA